MRHALRFTPVLLSLLVVLLGGCTNYRTLSFRVVDLESREPIADAMIVVEQGAGDAPFGPKTHKGSTNSDGVAKVIAADKPFVAVNADAGSYLGERFRILNPHGDPVVESTCVGTVEMLNDSEYEVRLLKGPQTVVTLIVPDNFAGTVTLEYGATDDWEPGDRRFDVVVEDRIAKLPATPALDVAHRFEARRASGERIAGPLGSWEDTEPLRSQVRLRGPVDGVRIPVYVIGDLDRFRTVMNAMYK